MPLELELAVEAATALINEEVGKVEHRSAVTTSVLWTPSVRLSSSSDKQGGPHRDLHSSVLMARRLNVSPVLV
ncbi:unnamed protein product [Vitrella brassicaformis CCMP3155]|uniref:Uncharacterized protein n=1 Tax=Vitrella brassicaformis (strain CCMP3155) TaxID=1169540 RepID=A0A0G4EPJ1_VITBC|nr:unnamed protein product [Vitrella brassicaformis CCMP3155]|eukprot:CEL99387.1 unnamed protein product [Vitrella brassicaformis CCMP3155]